MKASVNWRQLGVSAGVSGICLALVACGGGGGETVTSGINATVASTPSTMQVAAETNASETVSASALAAKTTPVPTGTGSTIETPKTKAGAGYFVDSKSGSDSNSGSLAAPWKSLAKLSGVALQTGEGIYLRCGSVWRESLVLGAGQLIDGTKIGAYGADCNGSNKPRVTGADDFSGGWTKVGNIWSRRIAAGLPKISKLFVNGVAQRTAQWPNFGGIGHEYALTAAGSTASNGVIQLSAADNAILAGKDLAGATVQVRTEPWYIEQGVVNAIIGGSLRLRNSTDHVINGGDGFVLQDKLWMLDAPGEFYHDTANSMLYVYASDTTMQANLNAGLVEGTVRDVGVVLTGRANVSLNNLAVDMARTDGVTLNQMPSVIAEGVDSSKNFGAGLRINLAVAPVAPARGATVRNGVYSGNEHAGIDAGNAANVDLRSNTVSGTGLSQAGWANAAIVSGDGAVVDGNSISGSAFRGILFSGFGGAKVTNNSVSEYCLRLSDCAALYTVNTLNRTVAGPGATVEGNRVLKGAFNVDGTTGGQIVAGIYVDDRSRNIVVRNNTLVSMPIGIFVHNSSNNTVEMNKVWLTTNVGLLAVMDNGSADLMTGNTFRSNQLAPAASATGAYPALPQINSSQAIRFLHALYGSNSLASGGNIFATNQFVVFNGQTGAIAHTGTTSPTNSLSITDWKALNAGEVLTAQSVTYAVYRSTLGAELLAGNEFESGIGDWTSYFSSAGFGGGASVISGLSGCKLQCVQVTTGIVGDRLSSPIFYMVAGKQYVISFTAVFRGKAEITHPNIARPYTPYESYVDSQGLKTANTTLSGNAGDVIRYEAFFTSSSSDQARVNLRVATPGVPVAFDSVSLRPVIGYTVSNFADWGSVVSAPPDAAKTVGCADLGWSAGCSVIDVDGNSVAMPTTLSAGTSKLLLWANSAWRN